MGKLCYTLFICLFLFIIVGCQEVTTVTNSTVVSTELTIQSDNIIVDMSNVYIEKENDQYIFTFEVNLNKSTNEIDSRTNYVAISLTEIHPDIKDGNDNEYTWLIEANKVNYTIKIPVSKNEIPNNKLVELEKILSGETIYTYLNICFYDKNKELFYVVNTFPTKDIS